MRKILFGVLFSTNILASGGHHHHVATDHAPIGVMGGHVHKKGDVMLSYRLMHMEMDGNRDRTNDISIANVHNNFMVAPTKMSMQMHMFGGMYGVTDRFTAMAMMPYVRKWMNHRTRMGVDFTTKTQGIGDIKLGGIYKLTDNLLLNTTVSFPTGSIDERGATPANSNAKLPYPMQLGTGTVDPTIGLTYNQYNENFAWGGQVKSTFRLYDNDEDYQFGNEYMASAWAGYNIAPELSVSLRLNGEIWEDFSGADSELNPMMVPTANPELRGGKRIDALVGVNMLHPTAGQRLAAEFGMPVYENLDGPQLSTDYTLTLGWQLAF